MIFNFSFEDFQKVLTENNGKPVYEITEGGFTLYWTMGGFIYQSTVTLEDILSSYREETGNPEAPLEKSIGAFFETYLRDCYQHRGEIAKQSIKTIGEQRPPVRVESKVPSKWAYKSVSGTEKIIPKSMWIESNPDTGNKIIKGINSSDAVTVVGLLEKAKEEEQKVFKVKTSIKTDVGTIPDRRDNTPPQKTATMEKEVPKTDSKKLKEMLKSG